MSSGDDGFFGWLQTVLYLVAAWACFRRSQRPTSLAEERGWSFLALASLGLGLNKQLDAQGWLLSGFKQLVRQAHLAEHTGLVRIVVLGIAGVGVLVAGAYGLNLVRRAHWGLRCALAGLVLLGPFVVLRMARFSHLPALLGGEGSIDVLLELVPTSFILVGALVEPGAEPRRGRS